MSRSQFQRNTRQREVILEELRKLHCHPTATGLYEIVRRQLPKVSLGTVYRNLELLSQMGIVRKLGFSGSEARFDGDVADHGHIRCIRCGRVEDVGGGPLDPAVSEDHDCRGYEVLGHRLELLGICPDCRRSSAESHKQTEL